MVKDHLMNGIRKAGLIKSFDWLYFQWNRFLYRRKNRLFQKTHPEIILPPPYMLYEAYRLDYEAYYTDGKDTATWIAEQVSGFIQLSEIRILEWGCGPGRIVQHIPIVFQKSEVFASDYNKQTIEWCNKHINKVSFSVNQLSPPLSYPPEFFDLVYALSVFTHLSEEHHLAWLEELYRVLKINGLLLITTQGNAFLSKLSENEKEKFNKSKAVVRAGVKEGHRSFSAFQPENFMRNLFSGHWKILRFIPGKIQDWGAEQDTWIVQKIG